MYTLCLVFTSDIYAQAIWKLYLSSAELQQHVCTHLTKKIGCLINGYSRPETAMPALSPDDPRNRQDFIPISYVWFPVHCCKSKATFKNTFITKWKQKTFFCEVIQHTEWFSINICSPKQSERQLQCVVTNTTRERVLFGDFIVFQCWKYVVLILIITCASHSNKL